MIKKSEVKSEVEKDILSKVSLESLLLKIEEISSKEEFNAFYRKENPVFNATGENSDWFYRKSEVPAKIWRYIAVHSKEYADEAGHLPYKMENHISDKKLRILNFGCGPNIEIEDENNVYYILDVNLEIIRKLKRRFINKTNVIVLSSLSEAFDLGRKFDYIYSHETLEHVRFLNEHIQLLYRLCKDDGYLHLSFPIDNTCGAHIVNLFEDTILRYPYTLLSITR
mgnify:CR=1 FL=1